MVVVVTVAVPRQAPRYCGTDPVPRRRRHRWVPCCQKWGPTGLCQPVQHVVATKAVTVAVMAAAVVAAVAKVAVALTRGCHRHGGGCHWECQVWGAGWEILVCTVWRVSSRSWAPSGASVLMTR